MKPRFKHPPIFLGQTRPRWLIADIMREGRSVGRLSVYRRGIAINVYKLRTEDGRLLDIVVVKS